MGEKYIYVGLFFIDTSYPRGIDSTINYFNSIEPDNRIIIERYIVDGTPERTKESLKDFLEKYPSGDRVTISERTSIISVLSLELDALKLDIPCFSISATSQLMKTLPNSLTYAPYDQFSVMNNFMVYKEYKMQHFQIFYISDTLDDAFFKSYIDLCQRQGSLLNIHVKVDVLQKGKEYQIKEHTAIVLLINDYTFIDKKFLNQIPKNCYISLTDVNDDVLDIFEKIPAFVILPFVVDYTETSRNVYDSLVDKINYVYNIYGFFDILYTLNFVIKKQIIFNLQNYVDANPFDTIPSAFGYSSWDLQINGSPYGLYDLIFTADSIVENYKRLFNLYNNGGISRLPQSQSIFRSMGIAPFFSSKIFLCLQNFIKIYNERKQLIIVRFEKNTTFYKGNQIIIAETLPCNFIVNYTDDGFFSYLQVINQICGNLSRVNKTMSKITNHLFINENKKGLIK